MTGRLLSPFPRAAALVLLLPVGCTWVTAADMEARRGDMDDDGDGYTFDEDCDDGDAEISPAREETWYDGVDQDCAGDDDYDADGDKFVSDEHAGLETEGVASSGGLPSGDCNDEDPAAWPSAPDTWYDGVDTNCEGDDDYDADGDGYVKPNADGLVTENVPGSGNLPGGDCDDAEGAVNPGATDDWYDHVDSDCGGEDDFDSDSDGYVPDEYFGEETKYVQGSGGLPPGDCDDTDATINEGQPETWYDGIDQDCSGDDNDMDQDGDGHEPDFLDGDDCDDTDPEVNPSSIETLGDAADSDCDGGADTFAMQELTAWWESVHTIEWTGPQELVFDANTDFVYLSLAMEHVLYVSNTSGVDVETDLYDSAMAFAFEVGAPSDGISEVVEWVRVTSEPTTTRLTPGHDFVALDEALFGAIGTQSTSDRRTIRLGGYDLSARTRFDLNYREGGSAGTVYDDFATITVALDDDENVHVLGCEAGTSVAQYMWASKAVAISGDDNDASIVQEIFEGYPASACALHFYGDPVATVRSNQGGGLSTTTFRPASDPIELTTTTDTTWNPGDIEVVEGAPAAWTVMADAVNAAIVILDSDGAETLWDVGSAPADVTATWDDANDQLVIGYVDDAGIPWMAWGTPDTGFEGLPLDVPWSAEECAVFVDPDGEFVLVAVAGEDDVRLGIAGI